MAIPVIHIQPRTAATGDSPVDHEQWRKFKEWMDDKKISWLAWSVSDKAETCSALNPSANSHGNWTEADIKEWGRITIAAIEGILILIPHAIVILRTFDISKAKTRP